MCILVQWIHLRSIGGDAATVPVCAARKLLDLLAANAFSRSSACPNAGNVARATMVRGAITRPRPFCSQQSKADLLRKVELLTGRLPLPTASKDGSWLSLLALENDISCFPHRSFATFRALLYQTRSAISLNSE